MKTLRNIILALILIIIYANTAYSKSATHVMLNDRATLIVISEKVI